MERLDSATTGLIEQEVRGRFPGDAVDSVAVLQYGDDPAVEPGQVVIQVTVGSAAEAEGGEEPLECVPPGQPGRDPAAPAGHLAAMAAGQPVQVRHQPGRRPAVRCCGCPRRTSRRVTSPR